MSIQDKHHPDLQYLLDVAESAVGDANNQIEYFTHEVRSLGKQVRSIALKTIDVLLSFPSQADIDLRKKEVVDQYSTVLHSFSEYVDEPLTSLNRSWMAVDQSLGFYLLSSGRDSDVNPSDVRQLIKAMIDAKVKIPGTADEIRNLMAAIRSSAGGLDGLDEAISGAIATLEKLVGELELAEAVLDRQITLAQRLHDLLQNG